MTRRKLPDRRPALTIEFEHTYPGSEPRTFGATIGLFEDGAPAEVFLNSVNGTDKQVTVDAHDAAVIVSFALQHGASLAEIGRAMLRDESGRAHGFMGAFVDAAIEALGDRPDDQQGSAPAGDDDPPRPTSPAAAEAIPEASEATL